MKDFTAAIKINLAFVILAGGVFPLIIWGLAQTFFPDQANGSLLHYKTGAIIGSRLIGQNFSQAKYFHPRPSAAGSGYDAANSGGTNLGPTGAKLFDGLKDDPSTKDVDESFDGVKKLADAYRTENGMSKTALIPSDAVTRSASGLDPHISPENAILQAPRIAKARSLQLKDVEDCIRLSTENRFLGLFGEPRVNVLALNMLLDERQGAKK